jgi:hypothetical protein
MKANFGFAGTAGTYEAMITNTSAIGGVRLFIEDGEISERSGLYNRDLVQI